MAFPSFPHFIYRRQRRAGRPHHHGGWRPPDLHLWVIYTSSPLHADHVGPTEIVYHSGITAPAAPRKSTTVINAVKIPMMIFRHPRSGDLDNRPHLIFPDHFDVTPHLKEATPEIRKITFRLKLTIL